MQNSIFAYRYSRWKFSSAACLQRGSCTPVMSSHLTCLYCGSNTVPLCQFCSCVTLQPCYVCVFDYNDIDGAYMVWWWLDHVYYLCRGDYIFSMVYWFVSWINYKIVTEFSRNFTPTRNTLVDEILGWSGSMIFCFLYSVKTELFIDFSKFNFSVGIFTCPYNCLDQGCSNTNLGKFFDQPWQGFALLWVF